MDIIVLVFNVHLGRPQSFLRVVRVLMTREDLSVSFPKIWQHVYKWINLNRNGGSMELEDDDDITTTTRNNILLDTTTIGRNNEETTTELDTLVITL